MREGIHANLDGEDLGLLIGRHGQTIDAIQHLAYRIAYRGEDERKRVTVDAAGYRERARCAAAAGRRRGGRGGAARRASRSRSTR